MFNVRILILIPTNHVKHKAKNKQLREKMHRLETKTAKSEN